MKLSESPHLPHAIHGFFDDAARHFGCALFPVLEGDRHFTYFEAQLPRAVFHFYLEGIPNEVYFVERNSTQHFAFITYEPCCGVIDRHPRYYFGIESAAFGNENTVPRPVYYLAALGVTRANNHICTGAACLIQAVQVIRIVGEIGIHLKDVFIITLQGPFEARYISRAEAQLTAALYDVQFAGVSVLKVFYDGRCAIG